MKMIPVKSKGSGEATQASTSYYNINLFRDFTIHFFVSFFLLLGLLTRLSFFFFFFSRCVYIWSYEPSLMSFLAISDGFSRGSSRKWRLSFFHRTQKNKWVPSFRLGYFRWPRWLSYNSTMCYFLFVVHQYNML